MSKARLRYPDLCRNRMKFGKAERVPNRRISRLICILKVELGMLIPVKELRMVSWRRF